MNGTRHGVLGYPSCRRSVGTMTATLNDTGMALSSRLRTTRLLAHLDQQQIADKLGVARTTVSTWERGETEPSATNFVLWALITGQPLEWLAEGVVRPKGLEPLTFWLGVGEWTPEDEALYRAEVAAFQLTNQPDGSQ